MGRVTGYISNELESRLTRLIEISGIEEITTSNLSYKDGLKYAILHDPFIELSSTGIAGFEAKVNNGNVIAEAIVKDFIMGHERRSEQHSTLLKLIKEQKDYNPAWPLITAYYCAFFCALDISKILSRVNINFNPADMEVIRQKTKGNLTGLASATNFTGVVSPECMKIKFMSTASKPHKYAWDNLYHALIKGAISDHEDWTELSTIKNILNGEKNWELPSAVRNTWNYSNPLLFNKKGVEVGVEFTKIAGKFDSAEYWLSSNMSSGGMSHHAASIALLCEILHKASSIAYETITQ